MLRKLWDLLCWLSPHRHAQFEWDAGLAGVRLSLRELPDGRSLTLRELP